MDKLLSKTDIEEIIGKPVNFLIYDQLSYISTVQELFNGYEFVLLLYRTSQYVGHWCGLKKIGNSILFFDSFGLEVDDELKWIRINYKAELSRILYYSPYELEYNDYKLQKDNANTCGRWCALFFLYCTNMDEFIAVFKFYSRFIDLDYLAYLLTE